MAWIFAVAASALLVLFFFPGRVFVFLLLFVPIAAAGGLYWWWSNSAAASVRSQIRTDARWDPEACPDPKAPIRIAFLNGTGKVVTTLWFRLEAFRSGYSDAVSRGSFSSDKILAVGENYGSCWSFQSAASTFHPKELAWNVDIIDAC